LTSFLLADTLPTSYYHYTVARCERWYNGGMPRRRNAPVEVAAQHISHIAELSDEKDVKLKEARVAEEKLNQAIRKAFRAGLTAAQIRQGCPFSETRLYQIRERKRR